MKYRNQWMVLGTSILLLNTMCETQKDFDNYKELHQHEGTDNYEVSTIFHREYEILAVYLDTIKKQLNVAGKINPIDKEKTVGGRKKVSNLGKVLDEGPGYLILRDGTLKAYNTYFNWAINGDKTEHQFKNPLTKEQKEDPKKWFMRFKQLYNQSSYIYIHISDYHFKIDEEWFVVESWDMGKALGLDLEKIYPAKENQDVRLMELRDLRYGNMEKDTTLVNLVAYEETDSEDGGWFNPISFSAGNYYMELYMPLGDTIKIKRYGSMGTNMQFYKMPVTQGGRNDVVFIVQEPNEMYPNKEFGGMYVVRPRDLKQEEYGPHKSNADSYISQYDSLKAGIIDVEAKFLKPMKE